MKCPNANRQRSDNALKCAALLEHGKNRDFCIHQYFCREKGKYLLNNDAANCKLREKEVR